ncbi:toll/interleukin-1 receptor domain-containing protein [Flavisolibacter sp. BT320]|nr:toll/interleukin-1 receptor domain-containing protein [Flavisolibacter longurius]
MSTRQFFKAETLNENLGTTRSAATRTVFLSYRHIDRQWVNDVVRFLKGMGVSVYVDYLDQTLEERTNEQVAGILRDRIRACAKFISLATPNSSNSKWMPWELGLGDRIINYPNVAVLPLTVTVNHWPDQEYGRIYGRIENNDNFFPKNDNWYVTFPDGRQINFRTWVLN